MGLRVSEFLDLWLKIWLPCHGILGALFSVGLGRYHSLIYKSQSMDNTAYL